eukprot:350781-Chlamydomonas_euryale.AAC.2
MRLPLPAPACAADTGALDKCGRESLGRRRSSCRGCIHECVACATSSTSARLNTPWTPGWDWPYMAASALGTVKGLASMATSALDAVSGLAVGAPTFKEYHIRLSRTRRTLV